MDIFNYDTILPNMRIITNNITLKLFTTHLIPTRSYVRELILIKEGKIVYKKILESKNYNDFNLNCKLVKYLNNAIKEHILNSKYKNEFLNEILINFANDIRLRVDENNLHEEFINSDYYLKFKLKNNL